MATYGRTRRARYVVARRQAPSSPDASVRSTGDMALAARGRAFRVGSPTCFIGLARGTAPAYGACRRVVSRSWHSRLGPT